MSHLCLLSSSQDVASNSVVMTNPMDKPDMAPVGDSPSFLKVETNVMAKGVIKAAGNAMAGDDPINKAVDGATTYHVAVAGGWRPRGIEVR